MRFIGYLQKQYLLGIFTGSRDEVDLHFLPTAGDTKQLFCLFALVHAIYVNTNRQNTSKLEHLHRCDSTFRENYRCGCKNTHKKEIWSLSLCLLDM